MILSGGWGLTGVLILTVFCSLVPGSNEQNLLQLTHMNPNLDLFDDLKVQNFMRNVRRSKRNVPKNISPPIPPPLAGKCQISESSGREICYPSYDELDTSCTEATGVHDHGIVAPLSIAHATVQTMAFIPPNNLKRLIRLYYHQLRVALPKDTTFIEKAILMVKYQCDPGYDMIDEIDEMFCSNRKWVLTEPVCKGRGLCEENNGRCSHSCLSIDNQTVVCSCPKGMVLETDEKTCIKPVPKDLCRNLADCSCSSIDEVQYTCTCGKEKEECLMLRGEPKIYLDPQPPYEIEPGGHINITCRGVAFPFPQIHWEKHHEDLEKKHRTKTGVVKSEQILLIKELFHSTMFTCHANNSLGSNQRQVHVVVKGPGSAPHVTGVNAGRTTITMHWNPPEIINNPIVSYTIFYATNAFLPVEKWQKLEIMEPEHEAIIQNVRPSTKYFIRIRANDNMGTGKPTNPIVVTTLRPAVLPVINITQGDVLHVPPQKKFTITCKDTRGNPMPTIFWEKDGTRITELKKRRTLTLNHKGLVEETLFQCSAENDAGTVTKTIKVIITGPTQPEKLQSEVDGTSIHLSWKPPKITNGDIVNYEVAYTDNPSLPIEQWSSIKTGGSDELTLLNLKEMTNYTITVRGISNLGPGLYTQNNILVSTGLADRTPIVNLKPKELKALEPSMQEMEFICEAVGIPKPEISWTWNSVPIEDGVDRFRLFDISDVNSKEETQSKLVFEASTRSGVISCHAENRDGADEQNVEIEILGPGSPPKHIRPKTLENGFHVEWEAPKYPNGEITGYILYYSKEPDLPLSEWTMVELNGDQTEVNVTGLEEEAPFVVKMRARNQDGLGIISETYNVTTGIKYIPLVVKLEIVNPSEVGKEETIVEPQQSIKFRCVAEGRPAPELSYTWLPFNTESGEESADLSVSTDENLEHHYKSNFVNSSTLTKRKLICQARNIDHIKTDSHVFTVLKPGSAPIGIKPIVDVDNSVSISWSPPLFPNGDIEKYKIYLTDDSTKPLDQWQVFEIEVDQVIEFERGKLKPESPYFVKISAVNEHGEGIASETVRFDTVSGAPLDAPFDILVSVEKDNTVNISWIGPTQPNGELQSYNVYIIPEGEDASDENYKNWKKIEVQSSENSGSLTLNPTNFDILPNTSYKIRITAINDLSEGPPSETALFVTGSGEILPVISFDPPMNLQMIPPLSGVSVNCSATGIPEPSVKWILVDGSEIGPLLELKNLITDVSVTCHAENKAGQVQEVLQIQINGPGTPPNEIVAIPMINEVLDVEWTAPEEPNGEITGYIIHYGEVPEGETEPTDWATISVDGNDIRHKIHNVKPKAHYAIKMQAVSERGPGVESEAIIVKTLPLTPDPPEHIDVVVHENNTVDVVFDPVLDPEDVNKTLKDYKILYTTGDPEQNDTKWKELLWTQTGANDDEIRARIDDVNFTPKTSYHLKIVAIGEIEGNPSEAVPFKTGSGSKNLVILKRKVQPGKYHFC